METIKYKDLSGWLKFAVIGGFIISFYLVLMFVVDLLSLF